MTNHQLIIAAFLVFSAALIGQGSHNKTLVVNGKVVPSGILQAQGKMYATILDRLSRLMRKGMGPEEALAAKPTQEFDAQWGDPRPFTLLAFKSLWGHFAPDA